jgi:hypothetical protein
MVRCTNTSGDMQADVPVWNPAGYMRNTIESTNIIVA